MRINYILISALLVFMILLSLNTQAQEVYKSSRVRILLDSSGLEPLTITGIDLSHGQYRKHEFFESDFNSKELSKLDEADIPYEVIIDDVRQYYIDRNLDPNYPVEEHTHSRQSGSCYPSRSAVYGEEPLNFELGSMMGFHRYAEIMYHLDRMHELYPHLISEREKIGAYNTFKGRSIFYLKISNNPEEDDLNKPKILFTALHHAREPISVTQLLYFMWYMLENYEKDDLVRSLIDHYELYFVPVVNPDGYVFNEQNSPMGGGDHRKNLKTYDGMHTGVDLNRNYRFNWRYDDIGSSPDPDSETYRGPFAGSEAETKAVMLLCELFPFDIAINNHSAGDVLLHPWGFSTEHVEDVLTFRELGQEMVRENAMTCGLVSNAKTLGYLTNGSSDDWMYGEQGDKPNKIFAFTPEIGHIDSDNFWPHISRIRPLCREMLHTNIVSTAMLGNYGLAMDASPEWVHDQIYHFQYNLKRLGLRGGQLSVGIEPLTDNISHVEPVQLYDLQKFETRICSHQISLVDGMSDFEEIRFVLTLDNGIYIHRDTITKKFLPDQRELLMDAALNFDFWDNSPNSIWTLDIDNNFSPPASFVSGEEELYPNNQNSTMTLKDPLDLRSASAAYITFKTKYAIEPRYDKVFFAASTTGFQFQPICGKLSKAASETDDMPVYDGFQYDWVLETIDLTDYLGERVYLRIGFQSDDSEQFEGFHFDDLKVVVVDDPLLSAGEDELTSIDFTLFPNPARDILFYRIEANSGYQNSWLRIYNASGQVIRLLEIDGFPDTGQIDIGSWNTGLYTYQLMDARGVHACGKFIIR